MPRLSLRFKNDCVVQPLHFLSLLQEQHDLIGASSSPELWNEDNTWAQSCCPQSTATCNMNV